jgi:hypothetical protein
MSIVSLGDDGHFFIIKEEKEWGVVLMGLLPSDG